MTPDERERLRELADADPRKSLPSKRAVQEALSRVLDENDRLREQLAEAEQRGRIAGAREVAEGEA